MTISNYTVRKMRGKVTFYSPYLIAICNNYDPMLVPCSSAGKFSMPPSRSIFSRNLRSPFAVCSIWLPDDSDAGADVFLGAWFLMLIRMSSISCTSSRVLSWACSTSNAVSLDASEARCWLIRRSINSIVSVGYRVRLSQFQYCDYCKNEKINN